MASSLIQSKSFKLDWARAASLAALICWAIVVSAPITFLTASHDLPLPVGQTGAVAPASAPRDGRWQAVHILVAGCPCSEFVATYLARRGPCRELAEKVWVVGGTAAWEGSLKKAGFRVERQNAEQVASQFGIEGGPWLRLISPAGAVAYSGGYAPQRPRSVEDFCDLALWRQVSHGQTVKAYDAFGCAASKRLRQTLDPFGVKYKPSA